jgi:hypothetical protein
MGPNTKQATWATVRAQGRLLPGSADRLGEQDIRSEMLSVMAEMGLDPKSTTTKWLRHSTNSVDEMFDT